MYRLLFALLCLSSGAPSAEIKLTQISRTSSVYHINTSFGDPCIDCPCSPDFAGPDKFVCQQTPAQSVEIGCPLNSTNPECMDLCFLWSSGPGLNPADNKKSNPTVNPTVTTEYTVTVISNKDPKNPIECGTYHVKVYVIEMQLVLYKPKVITGNTTTVAPSVGAQTFVNLDNDDNDTFYDNAKFELATGGIVGGDDELVRAELRLRPVDLPDKIVRLVATQGAADIKVWTDESKSGAEYILNTDILLSLDGGYLKKDLWIEGVSAHSIQQGTKLKMTYKGDDCGAAASITILGVENVSWEGNFNSYNDANILDSDPNFIPPVPIPPTWPLGVRVFPDARITDVMVPRNFAFLKVELSVIPIEPINLFARTFDVDDPTNNSPKGMLDPNFLNFIDPNDNGVAGIYNGTALTYSMDEDNRTNGTKSGTLAGQVGNSSVIVFDGVSISSRVKFINMSMHPGDNYRAVVNGDQDFLDNLENLDSRDGQRIVNTHVLVAGTNPAEILLPDIYASPVLTIWRFLNFEGDSMGGAGDDGSNELSEYFTDFSPNNSIMNLLQSVNNITRIFDDGSFNIIDRSAITTDPPPCTGDGRFQHGNVQVLNGVAGIHANAIINTNDDHSIALAGPLNLANALCTFEFTNPAGLHFSGTASLIASPIKINNPAGGGLYTWSLQNVVLSPAGATLVDFVGAGSKFKINSAKNVEIVGATIAPSTLRTSGFSLFTLLHDDDALPSAILPHYPEIADLSIYNSSYLEIINLGSISTNSPPFDPNIGDDPQDYDQVAICNQSRFSENDAFWCVHAINSWQGESNQDFDGDVLTLGVPTCPPMGSSTGIEINPLAGKTVTVQHNTDLSLGGDESYIYRETMREFALATEANTVAHEIGHQFGLTHGDNETNPFVAIPECCGPETMGLMSKSGIGNKIIPRHQNLIRSRVQSPGH